MLKTISLLFALLITSTFAKEEKTQQDPTIKLAAVKKLRKVIEKKNFVLLKKQLKVLKSRSKSRLGEEKIKKTL